MAGGAAPDEPGSTPSVPVPDSPKNLKASMARYRTLLSVGRKWREDQGYDKTWKRMRDIYRLKMLKASNQDQVPVAAGFSTINVIEPNVAINHPKFTVSARRPDAEDKATIAEAALNYSWQHFNMHPAFRHVVKDSLIYGIGWGKVIYCFEEEWQDRSDSEITDDFAVQRDAADQFAAENPHLAAEVPTDQQILDGVPQQKQVVVKDHPMYERVSPFDIFVDPEATGPEDWAWVAQRIVRPLKTVKNETKYDKSARNALNADSRVRWSQDDSPDKGEAQDVVQRVTLWEFYDLTAKTMCVFSDQGDKFLVAPTPFPYAYGVPFIPLFDYEVPDQFFSIGELEAIEGLQDELNNLRTSMVRAQDLDIQKFVGRKSALDSKALAALASANPNEVILVNDDSPLDQVIVPLARNTVNPQMYDFSRQIEDDIQYITGVSDYQRGSSSEISRTATEASIIQDASNARSADKLAKVEHHLGEAGRRIVQLWQQYLTTEQVVRIINPAGQTVWAQFSREDIEGEFDFEVEAGSTQPQNETFKRQTANAMLQAFGPMIGTFIAPEILIPILRDGFNIKNPEQYIMQPPPPMDPNAPVGPDGQPVPADQQVDGQTAPGGTPPSPENADGAFSALPQLEGQVGLSLDPQALGGGALGPQGGV